MGEGVFGLAGGWPWWSECESHIMELEVQGGRGYLDLLGGDFGGLNVNHIWS